ncbi:MAG: glycosyltransferase family 4 protein [Pseudomonadota bacterium]
MTEAPPTILQVIPELDAGGAEKTTVEVADAVVRAGGRAVIVTTHGRMIADAEAVGADVVRRNVVAKNPAAWISNARFLKRLIIERSVSLIHARSRAPAWSAEWAARRSGIPFVTTYHGAYGERNSLKKAYNAVMARGEVVIANSDYTARLVRERYDLANDPRVVTINRGVDLTAFDPAQITAERRAAMRAQFGLASADVDRPIVLHPARLTRLKGQTTVIAAAAKLRNMCTAAMPLILFGGGADGREDYVRELHGLIAKHGLADDVRLIGMIRDMPAALAESDLALLVSTVPETFGRTSVEAQAMGVPVIVSDLGAPPDMVRSEPKVTNDAITGWTVPAADADALAGRIAEALALTPQTRAAIGRRAATFARASFSIRRLQSDTLAVYDRPLGTDLAGRFADRDRETPDDPL